MNTYVYLAGNMNTKTTFRKDFKKATKGTNIIGLDPFVRNVKFTTDNAVGRDLLLINKSDYVLCDAYRCGNMTTGAAMELMIGKSLGKKVIALVPKRCSYFPSEGVHPFTWKFSDKVVYHIDDAVEYILKDLKDPMRVKNLQEQIEEFAWNEFPKDDIKLF